MPSAGTSFCAGPWVGTFVFETRASVPKKKDSTEKGKKAYKKARPKAAESLSFSPWELAPEEIGPINAEVFVSFIWDQVAGRPVGATEDWRRPVPVVVRIGGGRYPWW